ncbi:MAG: rod shape-determining protein [Armatimonadetes bacterium]|nr:rod shape-determining protein [Armatimonadota bacterium]
MQRIGLDLGTCTVLVADAHKGVLLKEPAVIASDSTQADGYTVGERARRMLGRTPAHIHAMRPVCRGAVGAPAATRELLKRVLPRAVGWKWRFHPEVVAAVPTRATRFEREALKQAIAAAGAGAVSIVEKPIAAAFGAGLKVGQPHAALIVDIGAGTTEVAAVSPEIVVCDCISVGGDAFDTAIVFHLRTCHGLEIGQESAEQIKLTIGSAHPRHDTRRLEVHGRDRSSGLPHHVTVTGRQVRLALEEPLRRIATLIHTTLDRTPPALSADVLQGGLVLTGGGALLRGLDEYLGQEIGQTVILAEDPVGCVARGTLIARACRN